MYYEPMTGWARPDYLQRTLAHPMARLLSGLVGLALILVGQWFAGHANAPVNWPIESRLDGLLEDSFDAPNSLAFALPLFIAGGALFAIGILSAAPVVARLSAEAVSAPAVWRQRDRALGVLVGAATLAMWSFLNIRLLDDDYQPYLRYVFAASLLLPVLLLATIDRRRGRLSVRFTRSKLVTAVVVLAIAGTFVGINIRDLDSWQYSAIGDERGFYALGADILHNKDVNWFSQRLGVFNEHPVLGSAWTALSMRVFGTGLFGWKMASVLAIILTLLFFYWAIAELCGRRPALFSTLFLGVSHYLFAYAHTGYNNIYALLPTTAAIACVVAGWRRQSYVLLFASGVFSGLGFYTFWSARAAIGVVLLAPFLCAWRVPRRNDLTLMAALLMGFTLTAVPIFATDGWYVISAMSKQSAASQDTSLVEQLGENLPRALLAFNFNDDALHYAAGALLDGISSSLAVAGIAVVVSRLHQQPGYRLILLWYLVAVTVAGVFFPYPSVAVSRMHYALPPVAAFAGIAVDRIIAWTEQFGTGRATSVATAATFTILAPALFLLNGQHFFHFSASRYRTPPETVIAREVTHPDCRDQSLRATVIMNRPNDMMDSSWHFFGLQGEKPLQLSFRDVAHTYYPHPGAGGGAGCTLLAEPYLPEIAAQANALNERADGEREARTVRDRSGQTQVLVASALDRGPLRREQVAPDWRTPLESADLSTIVKAQERDFVQPIENPTFISRDTTRMQPFEQVIVIRSGEESRAYPVRVLLWHGIIDDTFAGVPIAVTYDVVAGAARVYRREIDGQVLTLALTGLVQDGNALIYDRESETWWRQLTGEAIAGNHLGRRLQVYPSFIASWEAYAFSEGKRRRLLETGENAEEPYWRNPYLGYDSPDAQPIFTRSGYNPVIAPMRRVTVVDAGTRMVAIEFPEEGTDRNLVRRITVDGRFYHLFYDWKLVSGIDSQVPHVSASRWVGTVSVFDDTGRMLRPQDAGPRGFADESGNLFNSYGLAYFGPQERTHLNAPQQTVAFWFAASAAYPGIQVIDPWD